MRSAGLKTVGQLGGPLLGPGDADAGGSRKNRPGAGAGTRRDFDQASGHRDPFSHARSRLLVAAGTTNISEHRTAGADLPEDRQA